MGAAVSLSSGANDARADGQVIFEASDAFQITGASAGVGAGGFSTLDSVKSIDISTSAGAQDALGIINGAIQY